MAVDWTKQLYWEDVQVGDAVPSLSFPLSYHRMIVQAAANKDFSPIHINTEVARQQGAPEIYANNVFHQSMWERTVREYIGLGGTVKKMGPFRMKVFCTVGETVTVKGQVIKVWEEAGCGLVEIGLVSSTSRGDAVTGGMTVALPRKS